jgi:hypothetical protein
MEPEELPLQVGDTVKYDHYAAGPGVSGIIVECLSDDYLCVQWSDLSVVTKHPQPQSEKMG